MALLDILLYPDPALRKKSARVKKIDGATCRLLDNMAETMKKARGIGLSAPQVGVNIRVALVTDTRDFEAAVKNDGGGDGEEGENAKKPQGVPAPGLPVIEMINPVIKNASGRAVDSEGCLSIPGFTAKVGRKKTVEVQWLNRNGETRSMTTGGLTARIIQHETDHLDGVLFVDRLSRLKKEMMLKKIDRAFAARKEGGSG